MATKQLGKTDAEMQINFSALKKHDQNIQQIIDTASSVAHYKFNSSSGVWEKTEVEGSLFLYSRKTAPFVMIFIMNRLNKENAKLTLTSDMEFKVQEPFLLCKASNSEIIGIWFYDQAECRHFGALLNRFRALAKDERSLQISIMMEAQKNAKAQHDSKNGLIGMFAKAQEDYTKSRSKFVQDQKSNVQTQKKETPNKKNKIILHRGISEPNLSSNNPLENNDLVSRLEQKPPNNEKEEQIRKQRERFKEDHKKDQELLFNMLNLKAKPHNRTASVGHDSREELSKNSKLVSNAGDLATCNEQSISNHNVKEKAIDCAELESQFTKQVKDEGLEILNRITRTEKDSSPKSDVAPQMISSSFKPISLLEGFNKTAKSAVAPEVGVGSWLNNASITTIPSTNAAGVSSVSHTPDLTNQLLSPHVMTSSKGRGTTLSTLANGQPTLAANFKQGNKVKKSLDPKGIFPEAPSGAALNSLMSPAAFQLNSPNVPKVDDTNINKNGDINISRKDFQNFLLNMIQTDTEFVTKLHNAFLEQIQQR